MVLDQQVVHVPLGVERVFLVDGQREDLRERGVDETVVVREDAHPSQRVDSRQVFRVSGDATEIDQLLFIYGR